VYRALADSVAFRVVIPLFNDHKLLTDVLYHLTVSWQNNPLRAVSSSASVARPEKTRISLW
jgi:hypothetical protein